MCRSRLNACTCATVGRALLLLQVKLFCDIGFVDRCRCRCSQVTTIAGILQLWCDGYQQDLCRCVWPASGNAPPFRPIEIKLAEFMVITCH
jgi:hypothetical protein